MASFIQRHFVPVKIHIKQQPETFKRFGAQWTPTMLILDPEGEERHRFEGFLPAPEFLGQLALGLARTDFGRERWEKAEERFAEVLRRFPDTAAAPEALYWAGVAKYKRTGDGAALAETHQAFQKRYPDSTWATKASVWG